MAAARKSVPAAAALLVLVVVSSHAQMAGHGGPVRALAVSPDGNSLLSGSFDTALTSNQYSVNAVRIILRVWNMKTSQTRQVSIVQEL